MEIDTKLQLFEQIHNLCSNKITPDWIVRTKVILKIVKEW